MKRKRDRSHFKRETSLYSADSLWLVPSCFISVHVVDHCIGLCVFYLPFLCIPFCCYFSYRNVIWSPNFFFFFISKGDVLGKVEKQISREVEEEKNATLKVSWFVTTFTAVGFHLALFSSVREMYWAKKSSVASLGGARTAGFRISDLISCQLATTKCREIALIKRIVDTYWTRRCMFATFYPTVFYFIIFLF